MKFNLLRETLLKPLQIVSGVVERRQILPILSNVLISVHHNMLRLVATDLEVELIAHTAVESIEDGDVTISARKLLDICRALPEGVQIEISESENKVNVRAGKSRFRLSTLPANEFPQIQGLVPIITFKLTTSELKTLIDKTHFAMAQQDVRYYLNGILFEINAEKLRAVATDGHRLSICDSVVNTKATELIHAVIPRKGVLELQRMISDPDDISTIILSSNHIRVEIGGVTFTSKLVDGKFPDYERVIPQNATKRLVVNRIALKNALHRASILSNEKYRGIRLKISNGNLVASANNSELEEAEEFVTVDYNGEELEMGFNVNYIIDALAVISTDDVVFLFTDADGSCLIQPLNSKDSQHVVMPMRL